MHTPTPLLAADFRQLLSDELASEVTAQAVEILSELFAPGPHAVGSVMAGRTEEGIGEPETVALQTAILASDLLDAVGRDSAS